MTRGRKPKPVETLKLTGGYRKDRHGGTVQITDADDARPPADLPGDALQVWQEFAPTLTRHGLLKVVDGPVFEIIARELARWRRLEKLVAETGGEVIMVAGVPKTNPALTAANKARDAVLAAAIQFGMTPSARRNVQATSDGNAGDDGGRILNRLKVLGT